MMTGRVFLKDNHWMLETSVGFQIPVRGGEPGVGHPVLDRGRHENRRAIYRLDKNNKAIVLEIIHK
jgi:hypothetical protein